MASISFSLDSRSVKNGMCNVRMRISHRNTNCFINTGVKVEPSNFTGDLYCPIVGKSQMTKEKSAQLRLLVTKYDQLLIDIDRDDSINLDALTANDIRTYLIGERARPQKRVRACKTNNQDFMDWFDKYGQEKQTENTRRHYAYVWRLLCNYCNARNLRTLLFSDIDYSRLKDIRAWVLDGREDVTRYKVESYMHAAYKEAQRMKMVSRDNDPYDDFRIDRATRTKEDIDTISLKDLQRFLSLDLREQQGVEGLSKARDILWASFCLCGVNLCDIYNLPKTDEDEIVYIRQKNRNRRNVRSTHAAITMDVEAIIERYAGKDRLFRFAEDTPNYYTFQRRLNNRCERLSKLNGAQVNMQLIRRTWATIAGEVGVDWHVVDKSLGHMDDSVTDIHYQKFNWKKAAKQNQKVIDYVLKGVVPNSVRVPKLFRKSA